MRDLVGRRPLFGKIAAPAAPLTLAAADERVWVGRVSLSRASSGPVDRCGTGFHQRQQETEDRDEVPCVFLRPAPQKLSDPDRVRHRAVDIGFLARLVTGRDPQHRSRPQQLANLGPAATHPQPVDTPIELSPELPAACQCVLVDSQ